jgi:hypothetical protein
MIEIEYTKKPSGPTLRAALRKALNTGAPGVALIWGENQITVERTPYGLDGHGWIGRHGGQDLAAELRTR